MVPGHARPNCGLVPSGPVRSGDSARPLNVKTVPLPEMFYDSRNVGLSRKRKMHSYLNFETGVSLTGTHTHGQLSLSHTDDFCQLSSFLFHPLTGTQHPCRCSAGSKSVTDRHGLPQHSRQIWPTGQTKPTQFIFRERNAADTPPEGSPRLAAAAEPGVTRRRHPMTSYRVSCHTNSARPKPVPVPGDDDLSFSGFP